jgi:methylmalonyl-CoA mutase C-terminal domain/subunit
LEEAEVIAKAETRIIMAKFGLDGHSNGIRIVSKWLQDAGFSVIYMGLYNTAEGVIKAALEEDVSIIGCSFLEGSHLFYVQRLAELAKKHKMDDIKLVVGGIIPPDDVMKLKELGVKEVYTPGTLKDVVIAGIKALAKSPN